MAPTRFRAAASGTLIAEPLDWLTAVFHRTSGSTHLLAEPAPEMLLALADGPLTLDELLTRLSADYELADATGLDARLAELAAAGLIEPA